VPAGRAHQSWRENDAGTPTRHDQGGQNAVANVDAARANLHTEIARSRLGGVNRACTRTDQLA
jgi:hypothetical protein